MIKKKFVPVLSSHSSKPSQHKKSSSTQKKPSDSSLENVYRLPSSLKRTEDMISKSILQRQLSSKILDIVGSTFRVKNAAPSQGQYFCSPTNFSQFLKYKEYASSEFLETLYEVEGEDSFDNSLHSEAETNDEVSLLSIHTEQTRRAGEISMDKITNMFNTSFSQALERVGNQSVLLTDKDRKAYNTGLAMSLSTGRAKRRGSDPAKQVKQNLVGTRKMSYSLLGDVIGRKEDSMGMTVGVVKNQKAGTSKIGQRKKEVPVKQIDMRVKKSQEKESLSDKSLNKSIEVEISEEIKSVNASGSPKKVQGMKENKVKGSKGSSEPKFKTMPITQYDILKRSLDIKSQLLEPKRRMEIEIKRSVVSRKE